MTRSSETFYGSPPLVEGRVSIHEEPYPGYNLEVKRDLSVVVPVYNERDNIREVVDDLETTLSSGGTLFEIIVVDDGSSDGTLEIASLLEREYPHVRVVSHGVNQGKTAAMMTGFRHCKGDYIILMDGDRQFLAKDIPKMLEKLENGCDVVNGWGKKKEPLTKIIPSLIYNNVSRKLFSLNVHQFNLGYKGFKREALEGLTLKKDEHRYILPLLKEKGFTIEEVPVEYLPRANGSSKYGITRIPFGIMDMISLKIEMVLGERPFRVFGLVSSGLIVLGILMALLAVYERIFQHNIIMWDIAFSVMFLLCGVTLLFAGYAVEAVKCPRK